MTYFGVLLTFIVPPLVLLAVMVPMRVWRSLATGSELPPLQPYAVVIALVVIAVLYTTPWDNYLVATRVWWYDPALVTGLRIGWVPIEEYTFFVVQTLLTGLFTVWLLRWGKPTPATDSSLSLRLGTTALLGALWAASLVGLMSGWSEGRYLSLILVWALPPMMLQTTVGADLLWQRREVVLPAILLPTVYLWGVDWLAIGAGTWTINPAVITGLGIGHLPLEEMVFFLVTNILIVNGTTLVMLPAMQRRVQRFKLRVGWGTAHDRQTA